MNMKLAWWKITKKSMEKSVTINIEKISNEEKAKEYVLWSELDWLIDRDAHQVVIDPKYADNISSIRTNEIKMNQVKRLLADLLMKGNLTKNESKREEFRIPDGKDFWKKCKCLGSLMDTESDIN